MLKLVLMIADVAINEFPLSTHPVTIGRDNDNDVVLDDPVVSAHHARVSCAPGSDTAQLQDLNSKNGTRVNGKDTRRTALSPGDKIQIGRSVLIVAVDTTHPPTPSQS